MSRKRRTNKNNEDNNSTSRKTIGEISEDKFEDATKYEQSYSKSKSKSHQKSKRKPSKNKLMKSKKQISPKRQPGRSKKYDRPKQSMVNMDSEMKKRYEQEHLKRTIEFFEKQQFLTNESSMKNQTSTRLNTIRKTASRNCRRDLKKKSKKAAIVFEARENKSKMLSNSQLRKSPIQPSKQLSKKITENVLSQSNQVIPATSSNSLFVMNEKQIIELISSFLKTFQKGRIQIPEERQCYTAQTIIQDTELLELLYDELVELLGNMNTVRNSYHDIVKSLISLQKKPRRRSRQQLLPETQSQLLNESIYKSNFDQPQEQFTIERFMDPQTRNESFQELFQKVDNLKEEMQNFRSMFNIDGNLIIEKYKNRNLITYGQFNKWRIEIKELSKIIDQLLEEYNREVLDLFRISQMSSSN